jgi:hypothetical protein
MYMKKINQNVFAVPERDAKQKRKIKNKTKIDLLEIEDYFERTRTKYEVIKIFQDYLKLKLNDELQYFSTSIKIKDTIPRAIEFFLKDASEKYFSSDMGQTFIKRYIEMKDKFLSNELYTKYFNIFSEFWKQRGEDYFAEWVDTYIKPIHITTCLVLNPNALKKELLIFGIENEKKKKGRKINKSNDLINEFVPTFQKELELKYNGRKKGKSDETAAIKYACKYFGISFKHSIVTSYNNQKLKPNS